MRALEPDYIASLSHRLRILRLQEEATRVQEEILRLLGESIRDSIKELTEVAKNPEVTDEVLAELSAIKPVVDYSLPPADGEPALTLDNLRKEVGKEEEHLKETMRRIQECRAMVLELKEIESAVIETLFPEFEMSKIEWEEPVKSKKSKMRGLVPSILPKSSSSRMVRGEREEHP
jgi:dsDNA-specific endonuclease/ATPase MutS2